MTTSDLDARLDSLGAPPTPKCLTCAFLASLDEARKARLVELLEREGDERVSSRRVAAALTGIPGAPRRNSIDSHRAGHV